MKLISSLFLLTAIAILVTNGRAQTLSQMGIPRDPASPTVCYKRSISRPLGSIPSVCQADSENHLSLCYPKCKEGYQGQGSLCIQNCTEGYTERAFTCYKSMKDWSVRKTFGRGVGKRPTECPKNFELQDGLCYPLCDEGYTGQGPACWQKCKDPINIDCGTMCASDRLGCQRKTLSNMDYLFRMATKIEQLSDSIGALSVARDSNQRAMELLFGTARNAVNEGASMQDFMKMMQSSSGIINSRFPRITLEEIFRMAMFGSEPDWKQLAQLDPTGAADLILALNNKICSA